MGGTDFKWGGRAPLGPPLATTLHNGIERNRFIHGMTYETLHVLRNALRLELFLL